MGVPVLTSAMDPRSSARTLLVVALGLGGCAAQGPDLQREVDRLRTELAEVRAEQVATRQRLEAYQRERPEVETISLDPDRSRLRVVRIAPPEENDAAGPPSSGGRTRIHGTKGALSVDDIGEAERAAEAKAALSRAETLHAEKKYEPALAALTAFLVEFPDDAMAERASLLRGECLLATGDAGRAVDQFQAVLTAWPRSASVPAALRGMASAHDRLGHKGEAEKARARLRSEFPQAVKPQG